MEMVTVRRFGECEGAEELKLGAFLRRRSVRDLRSWCLHVWSSNFVMVWPGQVKTSPGSMMSVCSFQVPLILGRFGACLVWILARLVWELECQSSAHPATDICFLLATHSWIVDRVLVSPSETDVVIVDKGLRLKYAYICCRM
jgi:hypothetical protein